MVCLFCHIQITCLLAFLQHICYLLPTLDNFFFKKYVWVALPDILLLMPYAVEQCIPHLLLDLVLRSSQSPLAWFAVIACSWMLQHYHGTAFSSVFAVSTKTCLQLSSWSLLCIVLTFTFSSYTKSEISFHLLYCFGRMESIYYHNCSLHTELTPKKIYWALQIFFLH